MKAKTTISTVVKARECETRILSEIAILQQFGATLLGMLIPERKSKVWLAIQWGIIVLIAIAMWAFVRLASH